MKCLLFVSLFCFCVLLTSTGFGQELPGLSESVENVYPMNSTVPTIRFGLPDTGGALVNIGNYFFGGPLDASMAKHNAGRYLYFDDGWSKLWYYPMSGAFDWERTEAPERIDFDTSKDSLVELVKPALGIIQAVRDGSMHPLETLEFIKNSKVLVSRGTYESEDIGGSTTYVKRVDVRFRQAVAGLPIVHGSWAIVTFCGDMEVCRVRVLMREILDVVETETLPLEAVIDEMSISASRIDGPYYVSAVDHSRKSIVAYATRSNNYLLYGAAPVLQVPVCMSRIQSDVSECEIPSEILVPLVKDSETFELAERAKVIFNQSDKDAIPIVQPEKCKTSPDSRECAP